MLSTYIYVYFARYIIIYEIIYIPKGGFKFHLKGSGLRYLWNKKLIHPQNHSYTPKIIIKKNSKRGSLSLLTPPSNINYLLFKHF